MSLIEQGLRVALLLNDDRLVFRLAGEIDISNAAVISDAVLSTSSQFDGSLVLIDLTDVTFMDSSGLNAILACRAGLQGLRLGLEVHNPSPRVRRVFEITELTDLLA